MRASSRDQCHQSAPQSQEERLSADERADAQRDEEAARVWLNGLRAVQQKLGIRAIYDLSATPFFLRGSGYPEGTLFPWVLSDFSLIDAIEAGIVKIPRIPVSDDAVAAKSPTYRDLWVRIREGLSRKGRSAGDLPREPSLPAELEGALRSLYGNYEKSFAAWKTDGTGTPPVFIVVCQNTTTSKMVFDWIAGWEKTLPDLSDCPRARGATDLQQRRGRPMVGAPKDPPYRLGAARIGRGDGPRVQEDRGRRDRGIQGQLPGPIPRPLGGRDHRRGHTARGHEHDRQEGPPR